MLCAVGRNPSFSVFPRLEALDRFAGRLVTGQRLDVATADSVLADLVGDASGRLFGFPCFDDRDNVANLPKPIGHASGHRRRHSERLVNADEIKEHLMQRDLIGEIFELL
jgi:hypothetical protein